MDLPDEKVRFLRNYTAEERAVAEAEAADRGIALPERVYVIRDRHSRGLMCWENRSHVTRSVTEYVRADKLAALERALADALAKLDR